MSKSKKGVFKPLNPKKYKGDPYNIIYRSLLELHFMMFLDKSSAVLEWSSEETPIPYISPKDNRYHRYFVDFWVKKVGKDGKVSEILVEIKPKSQTSPPKKLLTEATAKQKNRYRKEAITWAVNCAKWDAATKYAEKRGMKFQILTEVDLKFNYKKK